MKKQTLTITTLGLLAILLGWLLIYISCRNKDNDCSGCQMTQQEEALVSYYHKGDIAVFKNDMTGVFDTMHVTEIDGFLTTCSYPCNNGEEGIYAYFNFSHLKECMVAVWHGSTPYISNAGVNSYFNLSGSLQTMTINSVTYDDLFVPSIDSTKIASGDINSTPWKIAYSNSKGFIRFYMVNGQTWSKL